jgi:hypothetical protein
MAERAWQSIVAHIIAARKQRERERERERKPLS